ncbi:TIGR01459 family HAD-type hydrolase [Tabrizicola sp. TH137]|uniref:TIGR01459 family HAD-type hydrolase n=1 Tax=Tabrizicola sp. TH137 TaxID=2067452 RepID=UPI000C7E243F|nr:TIGR01459 family HAD-type hydrolase [Tabrizicola sp. TH137]PLL14094.1 TIGR01459 family HAD-type hydrolase [Tabrizicola sp. TH137]
MTDLIPSLASVADDYDAVFCDLWGCLHNGQTPFPAAVAALRAFRAQGKTVLLLTNSPRPKGSVIAQLARIGVPTDAWDEIVSSGDATQYALLSGLVGNRVHHIGAAKDETFFTDLPADAPAFPIIRVPLTEAEGVVCTGLKDDLTETVEDYRATLLMMKTMGLTMLCANPDLIVDLGERRLYCAGALAQEYESMGGAALYYGKPHPPIYDLARRRLAALTGQDEARILAIGDGIGTDIQGGIGEGIDTLFVTAGIAAGEFGPDPARPDPARLRAWLEAQQLSPTYAIPFLA